MPLNTNNLGDSYSFLVFGHLYSGRECHPPATVLANLDSLIEDDSSFVISLGDLLKDPTEEKYNVLNKSLFSKLQKPVFNVAGNHEVGRQDFYDLYIKVFGPTTYSFKISDSLFVFLDSESNVPRREGDQVSFLSRAVQEANETGEIKNLFVFSHDFMEPVKRAASSLGGRSRVYWFQGATKKSFQSLLYEDVEKNRIKMIKTSLWDKANDFIIKVKVTPNAEPELILLPLSQRKAHPITHYNHQYWKSQRPTKERLSLLTKRRDFRLGFVAGAIIVGVLAGILMAL